MLLVIMNKLIPINLRKFKLIPINLNTSFWIELYPKPIRGEKSEY